MTDGHARLPRPPAGARLLIVDRAATLPSISRALGLGRFAIAAILILPLAILLKLLSDPALNVHLHGDLSHFVITSNVSIVAAAVGLLVARAALQLHHYRTLLVALGFTSMAGIFAVHGLATPGVLIVGELKEIGATLIIAASAQLSLFVPALFFGVRWMPVADRLQRIPIFRARILVLVTAVALAAYMVLSLSWPEEIGAIAVMSGYGDATSFPGYRGSYRELAPSWAVAVALGTIILFAFAAFRQGSEYMRSRRPTHVALAVAFVFLGEAQVAMLLGETWSAAWWEYHVLMGLATVLALGSLFVELDRRRGLERFLPPNVVERVIVGDSLSLEGQRRVATILFTDLRGSTALAERMTPEQTVATVNAYLRRMARAVIDEGGILDKFTGDGLMAIFGAMGDPGAGAQAAARAAMRMRADLGALNAERAALGEPVVGHGIGMHTGEVVLGAVGLPERSDYTALGDTVNTAARMEGLTKELGVEAVLSAETVALLDGAVPVRPLGEARVKGKAEPLRVFTFA